jgi:hypothetical protein
MGLTATIYSFQTVRVDSQMIGASRLLFSSTSGLPVRCMLFTFRRDPIPHNLYCVEVRDG